MKIHSTHTQIRCVQFSHLVVSVIALCSASMAMDGVISQPSGSLESLGVSRRQALSYRPCARESNFLPGLTGQRSTEGQSAIPLPWPGFQATAITDLKGDSSEDEGFQTADEGDSSDEGEDLKSIIANTVRATNKVPEEGEVALKHSLGLQSQLSNIPAWASEACQGDDLKLDTQPLSPSQLAEILPILDGFKRVYLWVGCCSFKDIEPLAKHETVVKLNVSKSLTVAGFIKFWKFLAATSTKKSDPNQLFFKGLETLDLSGKAIPESIILPSGLEIALPHVKNLTLRGRELINREACLNWFKKSLYPHETGIEGWNILGIMYQTGFKVSQDLGRARALYTKTAMNRSAMGNLLLGMMQEEAGNSAAALQSYTASQKDSVFAANDNDARIGIEALFKESQLPNIPVSLALRGPDIASRLGCIAAMEKKGLISPAKALTGASYSSLATRYALGSEIQQDISKAIYLYKKAHEYGKESWDHALEWEKDLLRGELSKTLIRLSLCYIQKAITSPSEARELYEHSERCATQSLNYIFVSENLRQSFLTALDLSTQHHLEQHPNLTPLEDARHRAEFRTHFISTFFKLGGL